MIIINIITTLFCLSFLSAFYGCAKSPASPEPSKNSFRYSVEIPSTGLDSLHIVLEITNPEYSDSIHLLAPPVYADNPWLEQTAPNFHNLSISDASNMAIEYGTDSVMVGLYKTLSISFPVTDTLIIAEYDITFNYIDTVKMPIPYLDSESGYLEGSYIFAIPYTDPHIVNVWRRNFDISVSYIIGQNISFFGDPLPEVYFNNPYELLFSTCAINANLLLSGEAGGQQFQFVSLPKDETINLELIVQAEDNFKIILNDITNIFDPINESPICVIFGINSAGGHEGMYVFSILSPWEDDSKGWFNMILAHEVLHFWIGLRVGDYEDPWWKEGTTSYLGYLVALRNNLCSDYFINNKLLKDLSGDNAVNTYALADPEVRKNLYSPGNNCESLVYDKGAQVTMLIDRRIREVSEGKTSIDKILGKFVKEFNGRAFHRHEYISYITEYSGADVSDIFEKYVKTVGIIPDSVLTENCTALVNMGAFGDITVSNNKGSEYQGYIPTIW